MKLNFYLHVKETWYIICKSCDIVLHCIGLDTLDKENITLKT